MSKLYWNKLLTSKTARIRNESSDIDARNAFEKDYDRIISNSSFRRLQDKSQVFPLERNDYIRTRLTHSIEVSSIAKSIGISIEKKILNKIQQDFDNYNKENNQQDKIEYKIGTVPTILSCTGLIHDIGNPPFGHAGEKIIQDKFKSFFDSVNCEYSLDDKMRNTFINFDGNPQTLRVITYLQSIKDCNGLNITYATLASSIKYPTSLIDPNFKKIGYFYSEEDIINNIFNETGLIINNKKVRHPLSFLLEAADDISYSIADIEDGIKKNIFSIDEIYNLKSLKRYNDVKLIKKNKDYHIKNNAIIDLKIFIQGKMIESIVSLFEKNYDKIMNGEYNKELLKDKNSECYELRNELYNLAKERIFVNQDIYKVEVSGVKAISNIIDLFLNEFSKCEFKDEILKSLKNNTKIINKIYNLVSENYRVMYEKKIKELMKSGKIDNKIFYYYTFLLITDYISGMTDSYCINLFRKLNGIDLY